MLSLPPTKASFYNQSVFYFIDNLENTSFYAFIFVLPDRVNFPSMHLTSLGKQIMNLTKN